MERVASYQQLTVLIEGILYKYFDKKPESEFSGNHEHIHRSFFNLKNNHPKYFQRLTFDINSHYPYSKDLDSILQDFQICGIINKLNPTFGTIRFSGDENFTTRKDKRIPFVKEEEFSGLAAELAL